MRHAWVGFVFVLFAQAQEEKKDDPKRVMVDAAQALRQTSKGNSFTFVGTLKTEANPDDADSEATKCKVSGGIGSPFYAVFKVKSETSSHEIVFKGGKLAGRLTWKGHPLELGNAPSEILSLVNFARLAIYVDSATSAKSLRDERIGDGDCRVFELVLPKETIRSQNEDAEAAEEEQKSVQGVDLRLCVQKSDGLVVKLEATVRRLYKDDDHPDDATKGVSSYSLTLKEIGTAKVAIPPGLEKMFKD